MKIIPPRLLNASVLLIGFLPVLQAQEIESVPGKLSRHDHSSESMPVLGPHQGTMRQLLDLQVETTVSEGGLRVYLFESNGQPIPVESGRGVASLSIQGKPKRYRYDLFPAEDGSLSALVDMSKIAGRQIEVSYQLVGIREEVVAFQDLALVPADPAEQNAVAIARQKVCPVSGKALGSMGKPIATVANGQQIFVCCAGCVGAVKANPTKYAMLHPKVVVVPFSEDDARLVVTQVKCPVMDEPLGSMGQPVKLLVAGQPLFLCCKGCIKRVKAEPEKYLTKVVQNTKSVSQGGEQVRPGVFKVNQDDQPFIASQKMCPVMDEPLHAMGGPYKVNANGKAIYICCPGCAKKIAQEPQTYLAALQARGVEAPLIK